jgi:hypothetical protein
LVTKRAVLALTSSFCKTAKSALVQSMRPHLIVAVRLSYLCCVVLHSPEQFWVTLRYPLASRPSALCEDVDSTNHHTKTNKQRRNAQQASCAISLCVLQVVLTASSQSNQPHTHNPIKHNEYVNVAPQSLSHCHACQPIAAILASVPCL